MNAVLQETAHRPWPMPDGPWVMAQSWHDLLFAHWPVDVAALHPFLPSKLRIDMLEGRYRPLGEVFRPQHGTLEYFLTERYCLYTTNWRGQIIRGEIHHAPWPLQRAEAEFAGNSMSASLGIALALRPFLHFARRQNVLVWPPSKIA